MNWLRLVEAGWKPSALVAIALIGGWIVSNTEPPSPLEWRPIQEPEVVQHAKDFVHPRKTEIDIKADEGPKDTAAETAIVGDSFAEIVEPSSKANSPELLTIVPESPLDEAVDPLPKIAALPPNFDMPRSAPAERLENLPSRPREPLEPIASVTIIIDDLGLNSATTRRFASMPGPLTLSFLPYGYNLVEQSRAALGSGHEVFVHLPMEPTGTEDPGPDAVRTGMNEDRIRSITLAALASLEGATGLNNHMGSRATTDRALVTPIMDVLRRNDLVFVDSFTTPFSVAETVAESSGVPASRRDVFLDNDPSPQAIRRQLSKLEKHARIHGTAIGIAHPYPATIEVLSNWLKGLSAKGIKLLPASDMVALRLCQQDAPCDPSERLVALQNSLPEKGCEFGVC